MMLHRQIIKTAISGVVSYLKLMQGVCCGRSFVQGWVKITCWGSLLTVPIILQAQKLSTNKQYEHHLRMSIIKWVCKNWRMSAVGVKLYSILYIIAFIIIIMIMQNLVAKYYTTLFLRLMWSLRAVKTWAVIGCNPPSRSIHFVIYVLILFI